MVVSPDREPTAAEREPFVRLQAELAAYGARYHELSRAFAKEALDPDDGSLSVAGHSGLAQAMASDLTEQSPRLRAWLETRAP